MRLFGLVLLGMITCGYAAAQAPDGATSPDVAYQFSSQDEMKQFISLIQERQAVETRIAVLEEYLLKERDRRDSINGQLLLKYKVDPAGNYRIDPDKMQIVIAPATTSAAGDVTPPPRDSMQQPVTKPSRPKRN